MYIEWGRVGWTDGHLPWAQLPAQKVQREVCAILGGSGRCSVAFVCSKDIQI